MPIRRGSHHDKGVGLARGPALLAGAALSTFGLVLFLSAGDTPTNGFPDGVVEGATFLGFEANGWTAWFFALAGAVMLFGAAQQLLARTFALITGLALGACSVIALVDGDDVLGLAAANGPTKLLFGASAAVCLAIALLPRVGGDHGDHTKDDATASTRDDRQRRDDRQADPVRVDERHDGDRTAGPAPAGERAAERGRTPARAGERPAATPAVTYDTTTGESVPESRETAHAQSGGNGGRPGATEPVSGGADRNPPPPAQ